ncbi:protein Vpy, partial [Trichinella spiralis]|uniref:protein Vpy n=1 Tax=Trichinella spiralis TaxID=6334 RepID=UPI0001EFE5E7
VQRQCQYVSIELVKCASMHAIKSIMYGVMSSPHMHTLQTGSGLSWISMAREKAKQPFDIQGRRRRAASFLASLGYGLHPERAHQESNPLVLELFISTSLNDPPGWVATGSAWSAQ